MKPLYKKYDFNNNIELVGYIFDSYINGQIKQAKKLLNEVTSNISADEFKMCLVNYFDGSSFKYISILLTLSENGQKYISLTNIINAFYDYDYNNYEKVKNYIQEQTEDFDI